MNVTWLIQSNLVDVEQQLEVRRYALEAGARVKEVVVIPHDEHLHIPEPITEEDGVVIPYGSTTMNRRVEANHSFKGFEYSAEAFDVKTWLANRTDMLNQAVVYVKAKDLGQLFPDANPDGYWFIRPQFEQKAFQAKCIPLREIRAFNNSKESGNFQIDPELSIAVSPPIDILAEYRFFVVGGKVISGSRYYVGGRKKPIRVDDIALIGAAQQMADGWLPFPNCAMDLALTEVGLRVVEFNCINSSGFYNHDVRAVVEALTQYHAKKDI